MYRGELDEAAMSGRPKAPLVLTETEREERVALTRRCIRRGTHRSTRELEHAIRQHIEDQQRRSEAVCLVEDASAGSSWIRLPACIGSRSSTSRRDA